MFVSEISHTGYSVWKFCFLGFFLSSKVLAMDASPNGQKKMSSGEKKPSKESYLNRDNKTQGEERECPVSYKSPALRLLGGIKALACIPIRAVCFSKIPPSIFFILLPYLLFLFLWVSGTDIFFTPMTFTSLVSVAFESLTSFTFTFFASPCLPSTYYKSLFHGLTSHQPLLILQILPTLMARGPGVNHFFLDIISLWKEEGGKWA